eukprot:scaffold6843_cov149-Isochrysis_galbana.AAC.4
MRPSSRVVGKLKHCSGWRPARRACVVRPVRLTACSHAPEMLPAQLDGSRMRPTADDLRLLSLDADGKQTRAPVAVRGAGKVLSRLGDHLKCGTHQLLVDFDAHLDDAQKDWFNTSLLK